MRTLAHLVVALAVMGTGPAVAQPAIPAAATLAQEAARRYPQPVAAGELVGRTVQRPLESQPILGRVSSIVRLPDGTPCAVVRYGAAIGINGAVLELGGRLIAVPLDGMTLVGNRMTIVSFTPQQLDAFPTFDPAGAMPVAPDTILKVGLSKPSH